MAERSREKPSEAEIDEATVFAVPGKPLRPPRPNDSMIPPPSSERTQMFVQPTPPPAVPPAPATGPLPLGTKTQYMASQPMPAPAAGGGRMGSSPQMMPGSQYPPPMGGGPQQQLHQGVHPDPRRMQQAPPPGAAAFRPAATPYIAPIGGPPPVLLQGKPDPRLVLITEPDSARAVSFRLLRDNLLAKRLPRVLAVSSPAKKEGKTICALNLALSLSEGAKVLLLEGNLTEPELATIFCIPEATPPWPPNVPWLGPYRIVEFSRTLHVGAMMRQPAHVPRVEAQWFEQLIGSLRRFPYDFIIIDAAALSASPTVSQLVATADATLLAVRSGLTTARALRRATEQVPAAKRIGVALIDAKVRT